MPSPQPRLEQSFAPSGSLTFMIWPPREPSFIGRKPICTCSPGLNFSFAQPSDTSCETEPPSKDQVEFALVAGDGEMQPGVRVDEFEFLHRARQVDHLGLVENREGVMREGRPRRERGGKPGKTQSCPGHWKLHDVGKLDSITGAANRKSALHPPPLAGEVRQAQRAGVGQVFAIRRAAV